jgi:hypothetical protein
MGPSTLLSIRRKVCCGFVSPLKNPSLLPVLNPRLLGQVERTLTTRPSRQLISVLLLRLLLGPSRSHRNRDLLTRYLYIILTLPTCPAYSKYLNHYVNNTDCENFPVLFNLAFLSSRKITFRYIHLVSVWLSLF